MSRLETASEGPARTCRALGVLAVDRNAAVAGGGGWVLDNDTSAGPQIVEVAAHTRAQG